MQFFISRMENFCFSLKVRLGSSKIKFSKKFSISKFFNSILKCKNFCLNILKIYRILSPHRITNEKIKRKTIPIKGNL